MVCYKVVNVRLFMVIHVHCIEEFGGQMDDEMASVCKYLNIKSQSVQV